MESYRKVYNVGGSKGRHAFNFNVIENEDKRVVEVEMEMTRDMAI